MTRQLIAVLLGVLLHTTVHAYEAGDFVARVGATGINPDDSSGSVLGGNNGVGVDSGSSLGVAVTFMIRDNLGIEFLGAMPFRHDLDGNGELSGVEIGEVKHIPPTLSAQYYFSAPLNLVPYVGLGVNYTMFFDEDTSNSLDEALSGGAYGIVQETSLKLENSLGLVAQAGVDWDIGQNWHFSAAIWKMSMSTDAEIRIRGTGGSDTAKVDVDIDPLVFMVGAGLRF